MEGFPVETINYVLSSFTATTNLPNTLSIYRSNLYNISIREQHATFAANGFIHVDCSFSHYDLHEDVEEIAR